MYRLRRSHHSLFLTTVNNQRTHNLKLIKIKLCNSHRDKVGIKGNHQKWPMEKTDNQTMPAINLEETSLFNTQKVQAT